MPAPPPPELIAAKAALRARMRAVRAGVGEARDAASARAAALAPAGAWRGLTVASVYLAMADEIDPAPVAARLSAAGLRITLPVVIARRAPLGFRAHAPGEPLIADAAGIPAPPPDAPALRPDLVIAPLLAFDRRGGRLGQGGGYYDRSLAALRAAGPLLAIGLAFAAQEVEAVPMGEGDQRLDAILTETAYIAV